MPHDGERLRRDNTPKATQSPSGALIIGCRLPPCHGSPPCSRLPFGPHAGHKVGLALRSPLNNHACVERTRANHCNNCSMRLHRTIDGKTMAAPKESACPWNRAGNVLCDVCRLPSSPRPGPRRRRGPGGPHQTAGSTAETACPHQQSMPDAATWDAKPRCRKSPGRNSTAWRQRRPGPTHRNRQECLARAEMLRHGCHMSVQLVLS